MRRSLTLGATLSFLFTLTCLGQSPAPNPSQDAGQPISQASNQPQITPKTKKVWTNENLSDANGPVSVVGNSKSAPKTKPATDKPADQQYIANTKKQIEKLQNQIDDTDKQLAQLDNFSKGEASPSSGVKLNKSFNRDPIDVQIRELQDKKKELQGKIDALLEEARKKGVEPGELR